MKNIFNKKIRWIKITTALLFIISVVFIFNLIQNNNTYELKDAKLSSEKKVFSAYETPKFKVTFDSSKKIGMLQKVFAAEDPVINAKFSMANDEKTSIEADVSEDIDGEYLISFPPTYSFTPGKYTLSANLKTADGERNFTQDFTWGVLALNPDKATYSPGETSKIAIGVLDEKGEMVCDADVELKISNDNSGTEDILSTKNGKIKVNKECSTKSFTLVPDYETSFKLNDIGTYHLTLTATTKNGTHVIEDSIKVDSNINFDIKRNSATRIFPLNKYPMIINVKANEDYKGYVSEEVPSSFAIIETKQDNKETDYAARIIEKGEKRILRWNVDWKKGENYKLSYVYDAPNISPEFYILGNLSLTNGFTEGRFWQIANDAFPTATTATSQEGANSTTSNVTLPASIAAGDLIIGIISADSGAGAMTWPSPWNEIKDVAGTGFQVSVGYLIASGGETTVGVTHTTERSEHIAIRIPASEWHGTTPPEISTGASGSSVNPNPDSLTASWGAEDNLWIAAFASDDSTVNTVSTFPTSYADNNVQNNTTTSAGNVAIASQGVNAASEDPGTFTISASETWNAYTIAVRPAGVSGINVSGNVYNSGTTTASSVCDANSGTNELSLRSNGNTYNASCSNTDGSYTFTSVLPPSGGGGMIAWINDLGTDGAIAIRYVGTGDSTSNIFYNNTVTVTSDDTSGVTNANMDTYDNADDADIPYTVTTNDLTVNSGIEFLVKIKTGVTNGSTVYDPGGTVTTNTTGGLFHIEDNSGASLDTATSAIGADITIDTGATLTIGASTIVSGGDITATGTLATSGTPTVTLRGTGSISGAGTKTFYNLIIGDGTTASTSLANSATVNNDATVGTGSTFNINADLTVTGSLTNTTTGIIDTTSGTPTVTVSGSSIGGGTGTVTIYNLTKSGAGTTTISGGSGGNTIDNNLSVTNGTFTQSSALSVTGDISVSTGATYNQNSTLTISGGSFTTAGTGVVNTTSGTGTVTISGTGTIGGGGTVTIYKLLVNGALTAASTITATNTIDVATGHTFTITGEDINSAGSFTNTGTGVVTCSGTTGTVTMTGGGTLGGGSGNITFCNLATSTTGTTAFSGAGTNTVNGNVSVGSSTTLNINSTISITGNLTNSTSGVIGTTTGTPTVTVSGTSIGGGTTGAITFYNLTKAGAGTTTFSNGGTNTINNNLSVSAGTFTQSNTLAVTGTASVSTGATLNTNANLTITGGSLTTAGTGLVNTTAGTGTVTINGTGGTIGGGGAVTVYNLTLGGSGTQTLSSTTTANNDMSVGTGKTLALNNQNLTVSGGDLTTTSTGSITCSGTTGTVTVNGTAATGIGSGAGAITFCNLTIGGTVPIASAITVNNDMTVNGTTSGTSNVTVNGSVAGTGTMNLTGGTFEQRIGAGENFGTTSGSNAWTFSTLIFSNSTGGSLTVTTQTGGSGNITASSLLQVGKGGDTGATVLNAGNRNWIISASVSTPLSLIGSSSVTAATSTFTYSGSGSVNLANISYYTLATNGSGTYSPTASPLVATNNVNIASGTLSLDTNNLTVGSSAVTNSGGISVGGTLSQSSSATTTIVSSSAGAATIGGAGSITFYNLSFLPTVASAPTLTLGSAGSQTITITNDLTIGNGTNGAIVTANTNNPIIDINGSLSIAASGTFTAPPSSLFTIAKNMTNNGTFNNNSGTVTFDTTNNSTFAGSGNPAITFNNFTSIIPTKILIFTAAEVFRIDGLFNVAGAAGNRINIQSTSGTRWKINSQGTSSVSYANIENSGCESGTLNVAVDGTSLNGGNNDVCWVFAEAAISSKVAGNTRISGSVRFK